MTEHEAIKKIRELQAHNNGLFDLDCHFATNIAVRCIEESQKYREIKDRLKTIYGECDGLLETFIDQAIENAVTILENHDGVDIGHLHQSRLLTDEDVDKWEAYKAIGTPEECRAAVEKQKEKKPTPIDYKKYARYVKNAEFLRGAYWCPGCEHVIRSGDYCNDCGQKLDWSDEDDN